MREDGAAAVKLFVAPDGNDMADGSERAPLATLTAARQKIRALKKTGPLPSGGVAVLVRGGTYALTDAFALAAEDSGTEAAPVVYRAAKRGTTLLSGGVALTDWRPVSDPAALRLLDPAAQSNVVMTVIPEKVLTTLPGFANGGCGFIAVAAEYPVALYQAGQRLPIARWPNEGFVNIDEGVGGGKSVPGVSERNFTNGVFRFTAPRLARWAGEPDLWFNGYWFHPWADERIGLKALDLQEQTVALTKNPVFGLRKGREFYAFNAIGEIDRPGEWAIDRASRRLYLWPAADPGATPVVMARCGTLVSAENTTNVTFEGFTFEACRQTALTLKNCTAVTVAASTVRHTGGWAVRIAGGSRCAVVGCDLEDLGEGGVDAEGGDRPALIPGKHLIENNHIRHFGRVVACYRPGASVRGVGHAVRHNLIYGSDHQAIFFDGNEHVIEYNIVHDVCLHTGDAGALYSCAGEWSKRGTVIRHNLIHATGDAVDENACRGIYLDDYTSGTRLYGNILSQHGRGLYIGGGKDNLVSNNVVLHCDESIVLGSRGIDSFAKADAERGRESGCYRALTRNLTRYSSDLWRSRYPALLDPLGMDPLDAQNAHGNVICGNVRMGSGEILILNAKNVMRTCVVTNNAEWEADAWLTKAGAPGLALNPDAPFGKNRQGFEPPRYGKMGLYDSPWRASPAVKFGPAATPALTCAERGRARGSTLFPVRAAAGEPALIQWVGTGTAARRISRATLTAAEGWLCVDMRHETDPKRLSLRRQEWGRADGVELALAIARSRKRHDEPFVLRGYADGRFESVTAGCATPEAAAHLAQAVRYTARTDGTDGWSCRWRIPLCAVGLGPDQPLLPLLANITVCRSADGSLTRWAQRYARDSWDMRGGYALWLTEFGDLPFLPGARPSLSRVSVLWGADRIPLKANEGAENPLWAVAGSRIEAQFGEVSADRWHAHEFAFTPEKGGTVLIEIKGAQGEPAVWTYYDAFRIEGAELVNGDFEEVSSDNLPAGWRMPPRTGGVPAMWIGNGRRAASGRRFVMASHDFCPTQPLRVKAGQKVTVRFKARGVLGSPAQAAAATKEDK